MREYIELNHKLRCETTDKNNEKMFKLINNSLCGPIYINKEKYNPNIRIISDIDEAKKVVSKDTFKDHDFINDESSLFNIEKQYIKLDSPCYTGACVLDLSKIFLYTYWYILKNKYKDNISMLYIDTDGFVYNIKNVDDVYKDMYEMDMFDMSCYNKSYKYYRSGECEIGKIKYESPLNVITEAVSLKEKLYAYEKESNEVKCKGVKKM